MNFSFAVTLTDDINTYLKITQNITANTLRNSYLDSSGGEIPETEYESSNVTFKAIPSLVQIRGNANLTELTTQGIQTIYDPILGSDGKFFRIDFAESGATDMFIQSAGYWSHNNKFFAKDDITAFHSSDRRLKENIEIIDDPLKKISQIEGVSFSWKDKEKYPLEYHNERELGVIAQDVLPVLPEIVKKRTDGYYAIKYEQIVPVLIEAVKQQQGDIIKLEERVIILEKQLDSEV